MRIRCLLLVIALAGAVSCGQKGPLVLPDAQRPPHKRLGAPKAAPASAPAPTTTAPPATPLEPNATALPSPPTAPTPATGAGSARSGAAAPPQ